MMEDKQFWELIDTCREGNESANDELLRAKLEKMSMDEVKAFYATFAKHHLALNTWRVWGAGHVIMGMVSGDSFHYFKSWLIGMGKDAVDTAMASPDDLGRFVSDPELVDNEMLEFAPIDVLDEREIDEDDYRVDLDEEPSGESWELETVGDLFPKLSKQFGSQS